MDSNLSNSSQSSNQSGVFRPVNHSIIGSDDKLKLFCWVLHKSNGAFSVNIGKHNIVADLRAVVKKAKEHALVGVNPDTLIV